MGETVAVVEIQVLHIDECPNWREAGARLRSALERLARSDVTVSFVLVANPVTAAATAFAGSPTIVVNGADLFPSGGGTSDLACRIYFTPQGVVGVPSEAQICDALTQVL